MLQGGVGVTLIDALDTLLVMDAPREFSHAVDLVTQRPDFDIDVRVHTFELTIRCDAGPPLCNCQVSDAT
jgi:hypothetical protein